MPEAKTEPCPACGSLLDVTGAQIFADRTCPVCGSQINVRRKFGHYELVGRVGQGGQGVVYRAVDNNLNRLVALKLLRTEYSNDPEFVKQFEAEARVTAGLNHPNIVRVYSFGADEGHVYLAMELVDKGTLDELMEQRGRIPEARALQIGIDVAQGLKAGYEKGLIHRDIKPGNVLFGEDGAAKVVDYGLAMFLEQAAAASGDIWGTPYYLSPERLSRTPEDFRSDIYSLGAALFHAIAGRPPFEAEDASHVALKHLRTQAVSLQTFAPDVSNATAYVINRTLAKNPAERQQSYDEFIQQLQFAREEALAKARDGGAQKGKARVVLENSAVQKANTWLTLATIGVLVLGLVTGAYFIFRGKDDSTQKGVQTAGIDSLGKGWADAQAKLIAGDYGGAAAGFSKLAEECDKGSTEKSWAIVNQALAAQFANGSPAAANVLQQLAGSGTQTGRFFHERVAPKVGTAERVPMDYARDFSKTNHEALGALFLGMKNYHAGHFDDAGPLIAQFMAATPEPALAWLAEYKKVAKPLSEEFSTYRAISDRLALAVAPKDKERVLAEVKDMPAKLPAGGKLRARAQQLITEAQKAVNELREARLKSNFAYKAKVTASSWSQTKADKPEDAVDGDPRTRWKNSTSDPTPWLAVDLGAPKTIGRWVLRMASGGGEKPENNLADFKLQRSDDGATWVDVDAVLDNRAGIIDRLVPPFSARHVRVQHLRTVRAGDTGARIFEFELSAAEEQAKAEYPPAEWVAMRFSTASDLIAGPVGTPAVAGSVSFDEKNGRYIVKASGADIWTNNDSFHFVYKPMRGDCEVIARVLTLEKKHDWTKVGVMIRSDFAKDASHGSVFCGPDNKAQYLYRSAAGAAAAAIKTDLTLPRWIKVARKGAVITGYESADGQKWRQIGSETLTGLGEVAYVGLAMTSHLDGTLATAEFGSVEIRPAK